MSWRGKGCPWCCQQVIRNFGKIPGWSFFWSALWCNNWYTCNSNLKGTAATHQMLCFPLQGYGKANHSLTADLLKQSSKYSTYASITWSDEWLICWPVVCSQTSQKTSNLVNRTESVKQLQLGLWNRMAFWKQIYCFSRYCCTMVCTILLFTMSKFSVSPELIRYGCS